MKLKNRLKAIWNAPQAIEQLEGKATVLASDLETVAEDLKDGYDKLDRQVDGIEDTLKDLPEARDFEKLAGEVEDVRDELIKVDSRVEDLEAEQVDHKWVRATVDRLDDIEAVLKAEFPARFPEAKVG